MLNSPQRRWDCLRKSSNTRGVKCKVCRTQWGFQTINRHVYVYTGVLPSVCSQHLNYIISLSGAIFFCIEIPDSIASMDDRLHSGDHIIAINGQDCQTADHVKAVEIIEVSTGKQTNGQTDRPHLRPVSRDDVDESRFIFQAIHIPYHWSLHRFNCLCRIWKSVCKVSPPFSLSLSLSLSLSPSLSKRKA